MSDEIKLAGGLFCLICAIVAWSACAFAGSIEDCDNENEKGQQ